MELFTYFRSTAAYRVRIALNLKGLQADYRYVHLLKDGGQQRQSAFRTVNPQGLVPVLADNGQVLIQSLAIIEYLEEVHPNPPLLPKDPLGRARCGRWRKSSPVTYIRLTTCACSYIWRSNWPWTMQPASSGITTGWWRGSMQLRNC